MDLLKDSDEGVGHDHRQKGQTVEGAGDDEQQRHHQKNQIEIGQGVFPDDVLHRFGRAVHPGVALAPAAPDLGFPARKSGCLLLGLIHFDRSSILKNAQRFDWPLL